MTPHPIEQVLAGLNAAGVRYLASLEDLVAMKRKTGRAQDQADVEALEAIRKRGGHG